MVNIRKESLLIDTVSDPDSEIKFLLFNNLIVFMQEKDESLITYSTKTALFFPIC